MTLTVTISNEISIEAGREAVWDYTQDFSRRTEWDGAISTARVISAGAPPTAAVRYRGNLSCTFQYKVFERPARTTLAMIDVRSPMFSGGGGKWTYENVDGHTIWRQVNSLTFRNSLLCVLFSAPVRWQLRRTTSRSMSRAKEILESGKR